MQSDDHVSRTDIPSSSVLIDDNIQESQNKNDRIISNDRHRNNNRYNKTYGNVSNNENFRNNGSSFSQSNVFSRPSHSSYHNESEKRRPSWNNKDNRGGDNFTNRGPERSHISYDGYQNESNKSRHSWNNKGYRGGDNYTNRGPEKSHTFYDGNRNEFNKSRHSRNKDNRGGINNINSESEKNYIYNNDSRINRCHQNEPVGYDNHSQNNCRKQKITYRSNINRNGYGKSDKNSHLSSTIKHIDTTKLDQRERLIHELCVNHCECMICMSMVEKDVAIWSCEKCYHILHLHCIIKWAQSADKDKNDEVSTNWRCPACQNENADIKINKILYTCFCSKQINPTFKLGMTPHSCGDVCAQGNRSNEQCPHLCSLQCHPGPCPPCDASVTKTCHCGRTRITARCISHESQFQCQSICDKPMKCEKHMCKKECHPEDGHHCEMMLIQKCFCGCSTREVLCGSPESLVNSFTCEKVCNQMKNCGNHPCELICHEGDCDECCLLPEKVKNCWCGKVSFEHLDKERQSCLDPVPSCQDSCGKTCGKCGHDCSEVCHGGACGPCPGMTTSKCRCKSTTLNVECASDESVQCKQWCKSKLLCGRHRCDKQCCDLDIHLCPLSCGRMLSCKDHRCDRECGHLGLCGSCPNVSFDELFCECGATFALPPIACGQKPPACPRPCARDHPCEHVVRHNCHTELECPPCTHLSMKPCPGGHTQYNNVPCFRPVATCGLVCGKALQGCQHACAKLCHTGECLLDGEVCSQPCTAVRVDCEHPCSAPCHVGDCDSVMTKCNKEIVLTCECSLRSCVIVCSKLASVTAILRSGGSSQAADVVLSPKDNKTRLACDSDCKRAARNCRLAEAFDQQIPLCVLYTFYPNSLREFGLRNKAYVVFVQNILVKMQNAFVNTTKLTQSETIKLVNYEQQQFIQRYVDCFKMQSTQITDKLGRVSVVIEANRGVSSVPKPLLTEVLREKYPHLFREEEPEKVKQISANMASSLSFAERLKLNK